MLGIIIGVASLIAMVSVGAGAQARVNEQIQSLGTNLLIVVSNSNNVRGVRGGGGSRATLTEDDAYAIQREIAIVQAAAPTLGACAGGSVATRLMRGAILGSPRAGSRWKGQG